MIDHLDNMLRHLLLTRIAVLTSEGQIRFRPPDDEWRNDVTSLGQIALSVYLCDVRENRKLRSNERVRSVAGGEASEEPAPTRIDCHYLITAWSPVLTGVALEAVLEEHALLYQATAVLINHAAPINPSRIYESGSAALAAVPEIIRESDLPTQILPAEGFAKLAEFWGTMGPNHRWKPALYLIVTLPVALDARPAGPIVTTRVIEYRQDDRPEMAEVLVQIGGHVLDATVDPPLPVPGAWVRLESVGGQPVRTVETDLLGRFTFVGLRPGRYQLNWRAAGFANPAAPRLIDVPSPSGEYDLRFE